VTEEDTLVQEDEEEAKAELSAEQKRARRRMLAQKAVGLAMEGQWEASIKVNREILEMFPDDPEASNRLGNALSELNRVPEAIEAYENSVRAQPTNVIAQRNLTRLRKIVDAGDVGAKPSQKLQSAFFIEEVGKTGITSLGELAAGETMVRVTAGDEVHVEEQEGKLIVKMTDGTYLGTVESHLAERLSRLMSGGNRYQAGIVMAEGSRLRILIREVFQSPEQEGRISFPPKTGTDVRAYTRDSLLRRGEDDEEVEEETADVEVDDIEDEEENPAEFGFSETSLANDS
jgi:tetratricopeptide (TPR) repeat protein